MPGAAWSGGPVTVLKYDDGADLLYATPIVIIII